MKIIANYPREKAALILIVGMMISCSHRVILSKPNTIQINGRDLIGLPFIPIKEVKKDTVKVELTDRQKLFYDKYFVPEFASLRNIVALQSKSISTQAKSINQLSQTITNMRLRSIRRNDSMQNVMYIEHQARIKLEKVYLDEQKKQVARNAIQITNLNDIANLLIAATIIMILCIIGLITVAVSLWKKVRILDRKFSNA